jgi:hypothetical protein
MSKKKLTLTQAVRRMNKVEKQFGESRIIDDPRYTEVDARLKEIVKQVKKEGIQ